jgi:signal transduction histidine kinase
LQEVLEDILTHALDLVAADDAHIFLFDGEVLSFGSARWLGGEATEPFSTPRENGITYTVARQGERLVIPSVNEHPLYVEWPWGGAIVGLPLKIGQRVVGVMNVAFDQPHEFDEDELRALELIGDQAAIAIENARLYEQSEAERNRVELLYNLAQDLASTLDPQEILRSALFRLSTDLGGLSSEAFILVPGSKRLRVRASYRQDGVTVDQLNAQLDLKLGKGFIGRSASERKVAVLEDVQRERDWRAMKKVFPEVRSAICAPVQSGTDLWGVITVFHGQTAGLRQDHAELLEAIAHQLSLALSNAVRYQQAERRLAELNAMQQVAQVVNRRLEMQPLLEEVVRQLGEVLGYPVVEIYLVDEDELVLGAALGGLMDESSRHPLSAGVVGRAVRTSQVEYVPDVAQDPDYVAAWPKTQSEIAVPLRVEEVIIGVLNVESPVRRGLTEDDVRLLTLLADHIAIAVENAALYERLQQHAEHLEKTIQERTAALEEALVQAQEADMLKTQFVSDVSHELRTPLSNILLYLELLSSGKREKFETYLETLSRETDRLIGLIEDLLAISRLDTGTVSPELKLVDLNHLARSLVEDRKRLFKERDLQVDMALQEKLPPVMGDESMLVQVVANLLTNAMHYTPSGGWVTLSTGAHNVDGKCWETLTVADTGLGIPKDEQKRIFERFFRGSASRLTTTPGTGLGLAICKEIMDRHQGKITLESQEGQGSAFTIWLPAQP